MACIQRMIKAGIIINRSSPISYRSFCSGSSSENIPRSFNVDAFAMVKALKAQGISPKHAKAVSSSMAEVLAELEKNPSHPSTSLQTKFEALRRSIKKMRPRESSTEDVACAQNPLKNREIRHIVYEFTLESRRRGQRIDQEIEALRREMRMVRFGVCFCFGMLIGMPAGALWFNSDSEQQTA